MGSEHTHVAAKLNKDGRVMESILIVDDDQSIREVLSEVLGQEGYDVRLAENGAKALEAMRTARPDVVVLDLMMPVMSGWEVLMTTDEDETLRTIPILVSSAMAVPVAGRDRHGGVRSCLPKPLDIPTLLDAVWSATHDDAPPVVTPPVPQEPPPTLREMRLLLVEDLADDAELLHGALRRAGYGVSIHRVTTEAEYRAALKNDWDVVVSDFALPGFSGRAALDILQESGRDLPFIMVSGSVGEDVAVQVMKAGAHDFFLKGNLAWLGAALEREVREATRRREMVVERRRVAAELEGLLTELRTAVKVRDDFLAIASHELKTPLSSLQLQVQLLQSRLDKDGAASVAETLGTKVAAIARPVARLAALVESLLDVTRLSSGHTVLQPENVDLELVVRETVSLHADIVAQSGSRVDVTAAQLVGHWDRARIELVVTNLLLNALKYGEGKPVEIHVDEVDGAARLVVLDHGMGIPDEARERIFHKFERAAPIEHFGGFGLGLWIAREAVTAHGGEIECDSRAGLGSTFTVLLPLRGRPTT